MGNKTALNLSNMQIGYWIRYLISRLNQDHQVTTSFKIHYEHRHQ